MRHEPFVSHAQNREDVVLARALCPDHNSGFWIDVGAGDPLFDSVTAAFSQRGWRGINVEPLSAEFARLCETRPKDVNLQVALAAAPGRSRLFEGPPENRGATTLVREIADRYEADGHVFNTVEVEVTTLAEVVSAHAPRVVDFLKIDVEGFEREVLEGADWSSFHPRVLVIEATEPGSPKPSHSAWEPLVLAQGYELALFDGLNRFYASRDEPDLLAALSVPANIHDDFVPYLWAQQVDDMAVVIRHEHDRASVAFEELETMRGELDAAQRMTAHMLDHAERTQHDAAEAREAYRMLAEEHAALLETRLFRYTKGMRRSFGRARSRRRRGGPSGAGDGAAQPDDLP